MTRTERKDIAIVIKEILSDPCEEIRSKWLVLRGDFKGFRDFIKRECVEIWSNHHPYLEKEYLDVETITIDGRIINFDGIWCMIRDNLKFDLNSRLAG